MTAPTSNAEVADRVTQQTNKIVAIGRMLISSDKDSGILNEQLSTIGDTIEQLATELRDDIIGWADTGAGNVVPMKHGAMLNVDSITEQLCTIRRNNYMSKCVAEAMEGHWEQERPSEAGAILAIRVQQEELCYAVWDLVDILGLEEYSHAIFAPLPDEFRRRLKQTKEMMGLKGQADGLTSGEPA